MRPQRRTETDRDYTRKLWLMRLSGAWLMALALSGFTASLVFGGWQALAFWGALTGMGLTVMAIVFICSNVSE